MSAGVRRTMLIGFAIVACASEQDAPVAPTADTDVRSPDRALAQLRRFAAARDAGDEIALAEIAATTVVDSPGDPTASPPNYGRDAMASSWRSRRAAVRDRCVLEVAIATARDAIGLLHCTSTITAKAPPLQRERQIRRIYHLRLRPDGRIATLTTWWDWRRALRQVGVKLDVDARPDAASDRSDVALANSDAREAANQRTAEAILTALDRRDDATLATKVAEGYTEHRLSAAEPVVFATGADFARARRDALASCEARSHRPLGTIAAGPWVALRFGRSCRRGERQVYTTRLWLMRFVDDRLVEGWDLGAEADEQRQLGHLDVSDVRRLVEAAGL